MLRVDLRTTLPGVLTLEALPEHRLKVHIGAPVRGACRLHRFVYTRGDVDILPAGLSEVWHEEDAGEALVEHFSPALLHRAASIMGHGRAGFEARYQLTDAQIERRPAMRS